MTHVLTWTCTCTCTLSALLLHLFRSLEGRLGTDVKTVFQEAATDQPAGFEYNNNATGRPNLH